MLYPPRLSTVDVESETAFQLFLTENSFELRVADNKNVESLNSVLLGIDCNIVFTEIICVSTYVPIFWSGILDTDSCCKFGSSTDVVVLYINGAVGCKHFGTVILSYGYRRTAVVHISSVTQCSSCCYSR